MKLLILGGTRFVGRRLVTAALARKHEVTMFNRGQHPLAELTTVETICGDRNTDLGKLKGRGWDVVIDTCGYLPRSVRLAAESLSESVDRYVFISSLSAYADFDQSDMDESGALAKLTTEQLEQANQIDSSRQTSAVTYGSMYGGLKALCEEAAEEALPGRVLNIRPGLIVGPHDYTDRFAYWVMRVARGGEILAPDRPDRFIQFIDVRDLAEWTITMTERKEAGTYNANGMPNDLTMERLLQECKSVSRSDATFTWASSQFLLQEKVAPWSEMPLWLNEDQVPRLRAFMFINSSKAVAAGLTFRPLSDTIAETKKWREAESSELKAGLKPDREQVLLRTWHEQVDRSNII